MAQWYVIHVVSGSEKTVKTKIQEQILKYDAKHEGEPKISSFFEEIIVPVTESVSVKRGKNVVTERTTMPSYILIKMEMNDKSWHLVKNVAKVTDFLGGKTTPSPLTQREVDNVLNQLELEAKKSQASQLFKIGETITVTDGPFDTFTGTVEEVDLEKNKLKVSILIFSKATPIELNFTQVQKIKSE